VGPGGALVPARLARAAATRDDRRAGGTILGELRGVESAGALRQHYCERDGDWARAAGGRCGLSDQPQADVRRVEDAAYGLRWLELARRLRLNPARSLVPQLPLTLLDDAADAR
jgi:hypothetical protein